MSDATVIAEERPDQPDVRFYQRGGYAPRPCFGAYPDNGLSLFFGMAL